MIELKREREKEGAWSHGTLLVIANSSSPRGSHVMVDMGAIWEGRGSKSDHVIR